MLILYVFSWTLLDIDEIDVCHTLAPSSSGNVAVLADFNFRPVKFRCIAIFAVMFLLPRFYCCAVWWMLVKSKGVYHILYLCCLIWLTDVFCGDTCCWPCAVESLKSQHSTAWMFEFFLVFIWKLMTALIYIIPANYESSPNAVGITWSQPQTCVHKTLIGSVATKRVIAN